MHGYLAVALAILTIVLKRCCWLSLLVQFLIVKSVDVCIQSGNYGAIKQTHLVRNTRPSIPYNIEPLNLRLDIL
jgi:mannose/fructose/N-acetylgalactosamine-specific phosphotransferase system component IIC